MFRSRNLNAVVVMPEDHLNHMVGENHVEGLCKCRRPVTQLDAIKIEGFDVRTRIGGHREGQGGTLSDGGAAVCCHPAGCYGNGATFIGIDREGVFHLCIGTDQHIVNPQSPLVFRSIGDGNILRIGGDIALV